VGIDRAKATVLILLGIIVVAAAITASSAPVIVPAGTRGVLLTWGQVSGVMDEGLHFIMPVMQTVVLMDVMIQKAERPEATASADLQEVTTTLAVNYRLNPGFVDEIYQNLRQDYVTRVIQPNVEESIKATTAQFEAEEFITKRAEVKLKFEEIIRERLAPYHVDVLSVSITDFQFSTQFTQAIEAKVTAEQKALEAKNKLEQIRYESQQQVIQAEAYYNATIVRAQADAESLRLRREQLGSTDLAVASVRKMERNIALLLRWRSCAILADSNEFYSTVKNFSLLFHDFCCCESLRYSSYFELDVIARLGAGDEYDKAFDLGYAVSSTAYFSDVSFIFFPFFDWRLPRDTSSAVSAVPSIPVAHPFHLLSHTDSPRFFA
jgi:prohibitin 2